jgi:hypothetical protein
MAAVILNEKSSENEVLSVIFSDKHKLDGNRAKPEGHDL